MARPRQLGKVFRDPVHNIINYRDEAVLGPLIVSLIDTPEMQRLRSVRQLGLANLVFHGAEHSRFAHSMGVAHVARRICDVFRNEMEPLDRVATVAAALLHDIGHAPFSHVMERVFHFHHESLSAAILLHPENASHQILHQVDPSLPQRVVDLICGATTGIGRDVVSSQMDADRLDYLLRDAHMTGAEVGRYDIERILIMLRSDRRGLLVDARAYEAVEGYLVSRYHMYRLIYFHRTVRCAETMLERAFARARFLAERGDRSVLPHGVLGAWVSGASVPGVNVATVADFDAWAALGSWQHHPDRILSQLASGLLHRKLFKARERVTLTSAPREGDDTELEQRILEELSPDERFLFSIDVAHDHPYLPYIGGAGEEAPAIRVVDSHGTIRHIEAISPIARALGEASYRLRRWIFHPDLEPKLRHIAGDAWDLT